VSTTTTDPHILTVRQDKTYRVVFRLKSATGTPVSLAGYGARFAVLNRPDGTVLIHVDDTTFDPGNPSDPAVVLEPAGATPGTGEIHIRLGADQTALLTKNGVYDCAIYSKTDATEIQPVCSGPLTLLRVGDE
jgi:hypothetical protein